MLRQSLGEAAAAPGLCATLFQRGVGGVRRQPRQLLRCVTPISNELATILASFRFDVAPPYHLNQHCASILRSSRRIAEAVRAAAAGPVGSRLRRVASRTRGS